MADLGYGDRQRLSETDLTIGELKEFIEQLIRQATGIAQPSAPDRSVHEILASMQRNIWTPPPGTPSNLELLREDRDR
jgi:hypothetical protein